MSNFESLLVFIAKRPGMYVGNCSIRAVSHYLDGYCHALKDMGGAETPLDGWVTWVESRFLISHPARHWTRILLHVYGSDYAAIQALPSLHEEFLGERARLGIMGIEEQHDARFLAAYEEVWHEPSQTTTTVDW